MTPTSYADLLNATRQQYPFDRWRRFYQQPEEKQGCDAVQGIFDTLVAGLIALGPEASEADKKQLFQQAIEATNDHEDIIETGEREDLCELTNTITTACGLHPADYGDGEGLASEWREW